MKIAISLVMWAVGIVLTMFAFLVSAFFAAVLFPFDRQRKMVHAQWFWLADAIVGLSPYWDLRVSGLENIDRRKAYVIVANHQSFADIIIMYKTRMQFKWVVKEDVYKVPLIREFLHLGRHIKLSRGKFADSRRFHRETAAWLDKGMSILFFPEGTISDTGKLGKFRNGAFKMAIKEKKPILPVFIDGTRKVFPNGSWIINTRVSVNLTVFPPIDTAGLRPADSARLKSAVCSKFESKTF